MSTAGPVVVFLVAFGVGVWLGRRLARARARERDWPSIPVMSTIDTQYTGEPCPYCGKPLYFTVRTWPVEGGRATKESRTGPHCDTPTCADKRAREQ
jgi:hypothetical protein